jgi:hypothetical protein
MKHHQIRNNVLGAPLEFHVTEQGQISVGMIVSDKMLAHLVQGDWLWKKPNLHFIQAPSLPHLMHAGGQAGPGVMAERLLDDLQRRGQA